LFCIGATALAVVVLGNLLLNGEPLTAGQMLWAIALALSGGLFAMMALWGPIGRRTQARATREVAGEEVFAESFVWKRSSRRPTNNSWYGLVTDGELVLVPSTESYETARHDLARLRATHFSAGLRNAKLVLEFGDEAFELRSVKDDLGRLHAALRDRAPGALHGESRLPQMTIRAGIRNGPRGKQP
jgi:hypothetical protein